MLYAVTSSIAASPLPFIVGGQLSDTWAWSALSFQTNLATVVEEHKPWMPLASLFSKITFTSDVLMAADPFSRGYFDPRSPCSPKALKYYRDALCLYNYYLRWSSKIWLNDDRWRVRRRDHLENVKEVGRFEIISLGQLVLQLSPFHLPSIIISVPLSLEWFICDMLRAEFLPQEKRKVIYSEVQRRRVLGGVSISW